MKPVDLERFWADDEIAHKDNCFSKDAPQVAMGIRMSDECVFAQLNEPGNPWGETPRERRMDLNRRYNDLAEKIVGRRLLREDFPLEDEILPAYRGIGEVFEGEYKFDGNVTWLHGSCSNPKELEEMLDRVDKLDIRILSCRITGIPKKNAFLKHTAKSLHFGVMCVGPLLWQHRFLVWKI